ncbi:O-antigen polymerase [Pseudomonas sp.]|uniref:O-antigen polymerase n=1 Tax=Pseudomonas sp. TaxID=306 RepID=UPI003BB5DDBA
MGAVFIYPLFLTLLVGCSFPLAYFFELELVSVDVFWLVLLHLGGYCFGALIFGFLFFKVGRGPVYGTNVPMRYSMHLGLFVGIALIVYAYYLMGGVPALSENVENARVQMKQGVGKYIIFGVGFIYVSISYLSVMCLKDGSRLARCFLLPMTWLVVSLLLIGIGYRSLCFFLLVHVVLYFLLCREKLRFKTLLSGKVIAGTLLLFLVMSLLGYVRYKEGTEGFGALSFFWPLIVYGGNIELIFDVVGWQGFSYGEYFMLDMISPVLGDGKFTGHHIKDILDLKFDGEGVSITIIGESYLNFGMLGVFLFGFLIGGVTLLLSKFVFCRGYIYRMFFVIFLVFTIRVITSGTVLIFWFYLVPVVFAYFFVLFGALLEKSFLMNSCKIY